MNLDKNDYANHDKSDRQQIVSSEIKQIQLLEERLQVDRRRKKIGEVIVRKEVETQIVELPIRREKLIIERIGENPEKLTEVILSEEKINNFGYEELQDANSLHIIKSVYLDLETAQNLLESIAKLSTAKDTQIRIEITSNNSQDRADCQNICDRYQQNKI